MIGGSILIRISRYVGTESRGGYVPTPQYISLSMLAVWAPIFRGGPALVFRPINSDSVVRGPTGSSCDLGSSSLLLPELKFSRLASCASFEWLTLFRRDTGKASGHVPSFGVSAECQWAGFAVFDGSTGLENNRKPMGGLLGDFFRIARLGDTRDP